MRFKINKQDAWASGVLCVLGLGVVLQGSTYTMGTLSRMGPGFFPVALGALLIFLGVVLLFSSALSENDEEDEDFGTAEWRGWLCIVAGVLAFIVLGQYGGLVPATFALVFISALGDRTHTLLTALALSVFVTVLGILIFVWALELQFPMFRWG